MTIDHDEPLDLGLPAPTPASRSGRSGRAARAVRWALVQRVRHQIAEGRYLTPERWDATVARVARCFE